MKQFLTIFAILIVLSGVGVAAYFLFFAHTGPHLEVGNTSGSFNDALSHATVTQDTTDTVGSAGILVAPGLVQITKDPVASGLAIFNTTIPVSTGTASGTPASTPDIAVRYIDRASGNVYEYTVVGRSLSRIGNKTLPGIQKASWLNDGSVAFAQFLSNEHVQTYALPAVGTSGYFLQQDLSQASVIGSSTVFTLAEGANSSVGTIARADGSNARTLFNTSLTNLRVFSSGADYIAVPKAAKTLDGYAFVINAGGTFTPVLGPLKGLVVLPSPSGKQILYSYMDGTTLTTNVFDRVSGEVIELPLATMPEKCVWTANSAAIYCGVPIALSGSLPDDWYQGAVSFSDRIWNFDLQARTATLVLNPATVKADIDAVDLTVDPNAHALLFRNKKDSSLWVYNL